MLIAMVIGVLNLLVNGNDHGVRLINRCAAPDPSPSGPVTSAICWRRQRWRFMLGLAEAVSIARAVAGSNQH
jgi:hypothetical protein